MHPHTAGAAALLESAVGYRDQTFGELRDSGVRVAVRCVPCRRRSYPDCSNADLAERTPGSARFACAKCGGEGLMLFVPPRRTLPRRRPQQAHDAALPVHALRSGFSPMKGRSDHGRY